MSEQNTSPEHQLRSFNAAQAFGGGEASAVEVAQRKETRTDAEGNVAEVVVSTIEHSSTGQRVELDGSFVDKAIERDAVLGDERLLHDMGGVAVDFAGMLDPESRVHVSDMFKQSEIFVQPVQETKNEQVVEAEFEISDEVKEALSIALRYVEQGEQERGQNFMRNSRNLAEFENTLRSTVGKVRNRQLRPYDAENVAEQARMIIRGLAQEVEAGARDSKIAHGVGSVVDNVSEALGSLPRMSGRRLRIESTTGSIKESTDRLRVLYGRQAGDATELRSRIQRFSNSIEDEVRMMLGGRMDPEEVAPRFSRLAGDIAESLGSRGYVNEETRQLVASLLNNSQMLRRL